MNRSTTNRALISITFALLAPLATRVEGKPYVPDNDAIVVERVPAALAARQLEPLRRRLNARPQDLGSALELARGYLDIGRETSDPRFVSYAQATLAPFLQQQKPPVAVLVLTATALQYQHQFDAALSMLERALASDPGDAQAWLTKATLLQVQGHFQAARDACRRLLQTADQLIALTCIASADSHSGRLEPSYRSLQRFFAANRQADHNIRSWVLGHLGEMAVRLGDFAAAEGHFKAGLSATPADVYLKGAYADLLLLQQRDREVIELLSGSESQDVLLLRLAIAGQRLRTTEAGDWARSYDARRRAARQDDDPHLREHARFLLDVRNEPVEALQVAQRNWNVQRESADVRIYLRAALAAGQPHAADVVRKWLLDTGYEDHTLDVTSQIAAGPP